MIIGILFYGTHLLHCLVELKVVHLNLLPTFASIRASNKRKSRTILFRQIQHTSTSKYQFSKTYLQSSILYIQLIRCLNIQEYTPRIFSTMNKIMEDGYSYWLEGSGRNAAPAPTFSPQTPRTSLGRAAPPSPPSGEESLNLVPHHLQSQNPLALCHYESWYFICSSLPLSTPRRTSNGLETKD